MRSNILVGVVLAQSVEELFILRFAGRVERFFQFSLDGFGAIESEC